MRLLDRPDLLDQLAACYALGTLRGGARRRFEALARDSATVRASALLWQERLASLTELQPAHAPSPNVWKRIENALEQQRAQNAVAVQPQQPAAGVQAAVESAVRRSLLWWRGAALGAALAAVVAVVGSFQLRQDLVRERGALAAAQSAREQLASRLEAVPNIQYVSVLQDEKATATLLVTVDGDRNVLTVKRVDTYQEPGDKSLELWALPTGGAPQSLGVIASDRIVRLPGAGGRAVQAPTLAVTLEPKGGAPVTGPTGPVLFKGPLLHTAL